LIESNVKDTLENKSSRKNNNEVSTSRAHKEKLFASEKKMQATQ
jgi:hypothetical protein